MTIDAAYLSINQLVIGLVLQHSRSNRMTWLLSIFSLKFLWGKLKDMSRLFQNLRESDLTLPSK